MRNGHSALWLTLALLLCAPLGWAQTAATDFELELGWRSLDVNGNKDMYRTQINEEEGFLLRSFHLTTQDFDGATSFIDHFRIDVSELGAGPAGYLRLETGKSSSYNLLFTYREADMYSALPYHANPLLEQGLLVVPGQHTLDRTRTTFDVDLEFLRWNRITPFIGYTWFQNEGPGTTTYTLGGDDFQLASDLDEKDTELRAGFSFNLGSFYGQLTQGWRSLESDETLRLLPGAGAGNNPGVVLGRPITSTGITRTSETEVDTPFTNFYVTGAFGPRLRVTGDFVTYKAESEGFEDEFASGSFASFGIRRFFSGFEESVVSKAENKSWRGGLRAEFELLPNVDLVAGLRERNRELRGSSLINSLFLNSVGFSGGPASDLQELLSTDNWLEREEMTVNVGVRARAIGPFTAWAFFQQTEQDLTYSPDLAEIVIEGSQGGTFNRSIDTIDLGGSFNMAGFNVTAAWRTDEADEPVTRTDFLDRDRARLRASWTSPARRIRVGATAERIDQSNDRAGFQYDSEVRQLSADLELSPVDPVQVWVNWSDYEVDSSILIRLPQNFQTVPSIHTETGDSIEAGLRLFVRRLTADLSFGQFKNEGNYPFDIDRFRTRLAYDFNDRYGIAGEWSYDEYSEDLLGLGNYDADRIGVFLRWRP
jgi:hypothetical protein